ncbi:MAG: hypothetical protein WEE89_18785, partial [Gemmatimonadota bacterium]
VACFFYVAAAVVRLARFNVEQAGHAKAVFHGLPSPSAGIALASFFPFSQTDFFRLYLSDWKWPSIMIGVMVVLGFLMISHVPYAVVPKFGFRNVRGIVNFVFLVTMTVLAITIPRLFFFLGSMSYVAYGLLKVLFLGFFEKLPEHDPLLDEDPDEAGAELRVIDYGEITPHRRFRIPGYRRRRRGDRRRPNRPDSPPDQKPKEAP